MAQKCDINEITVSRGIQSSARRQMEMSNLFDYQDELFTIKSEDSDYQGVVDDINNSFGEDIVMKFPSQPIFAITEPSISLINKYLTKAGVFQSANNIEEDFLPAEEEKEFRRLQDMGLISEESNIVDGREYYKVPGSDESALALKEIIQAKNLDFLHLTDSIDGTLVQVGRVEKSPEQFPITISTKANPITKNRVLRFLKNIGFTEIQEVKELIYNGQPIKGSSYIDFASGVMQIVEGKSDYTLPEEAMHILTTLVKQSRPELYGRMFSQIINYKLYRELVNDPDYIKNPLYQTEDGAIDYNKIREEAIAKVMAEYLINQLQPSAESDRRLEQVMNWWQQIVQWIREKFGKYKNPFKETLDEMNASDTTFGEYADISSDDIFLAAKSVDQIDQENPDNKSIWETIKNRPDNLNIYKVDSDYFKENNRQTYSSTYLASLTDQELQSLADSLSVKINLTDKEKAFRIISAAGSRRTSDDVSRYYYKLFGNRNFDEVQQAFYEESRKDGSYLHEIFEAVINSWIDPQTGLMRRTQEKIDFPLDSNPIQGKIVKDVQRFIKNYMKIYPEGTRFLTEQIIYDQAKDKYGTIDFLAIKPDGTVDIIDWKSVLLQDLQGAKDYKKGAIFVQLNEYMRILKEDYNIDKIGKVRAIPVKKHYKKDSDGNRKLESVEIGPANAAAVQQKYLRPIISPEESTGSEEKDEIIQKLEALYQKYVDKGYFQTDRNILEDVQDAIYEIRVSGSVESLASYFNDLTAKFKQFLPELEKLADKDKQDISEGISLVNFYLDIINNIVKPSFILATDNTIDIESRRKLQSASNDLNALSRLFERNLEKLLDGLAKKDGVFDLLKPEKVVNFFRRWFRSMGSQQIASVRYMYELTNKAYNQLELKTDDDITSLKNLRFNFLEWAKKNNLKEEQAVEKLVNMKEGRIHSKISSDFYTARDKLLEERDGKEIIKFVTENYNLDDYRNWYNTQLAENKKLWESTPYDSDEKVRKQIVRNKIQTFEKNYNIFSSPVTAYGYHNPKIWGRNIKEEKWLSEEYKELTKEGNEPLLDMYNFMVNKNKMLAESGAIKDYQQYTFFPSVRKSYTDIFSFGDKSLLSKIADLTITSYKNWRSSISVDDYQLNFQGARDPFTGKLLEKRYIPYVQKFDKEPQSFDIFKIYSLMSREINKEKYLQENDEILRSLVHFEKAKPNLVQNKFGKVAATASGRLEKTNAQDVGKNAPVIEEHYRAISEGQILQTDNDFTVRFRLREKWNNSPLGKLYRFDIDGDNYKPTNVSATKFIMWLNRFNTRRVLGLNAGSILSNLFGGSYASNRLYKKYMNEGDINSAWLKMTSGAFYSTEEMKKNAALANYFLPFLNNNENIKSNLLSINESAKLLSQDWLMAPMRKTSEIVQLNIFFGIIENTGIVDGKLVNLKEMAAKEIGYYDRFSEGTEKAAKEVEKKLQDRLKVLKDKYALKKTAKFKTIEEAGKKKVVIDLPGIDRYGNDVAHLRDIVKTMSKDSLGESSEWNIQNYKYSLLGRLFMTFKNWIPDQAEVRFGEFRYDQAHHAWEYGRFRMFAKAFNANAIQAIAKLVPLPYLTGKVTNFVFTKDLLISRAKDIYAQKVEEMKKLGKYNESFITEGEFVDKFVQGTEQTFEEVRTIILFNLLIFMGLAAPDDDDDSELKAIKSRMRKQIDKMSDEVGFFYSPANGIDIAGGGLPMLSLIKDFWKFGTSTTEQFLGYSFEQIGWDEKGIKMQESAKPSKALFKVIPVMKELLQYIPTFDEDMAKEWGIKINDRRGF